MHTVHKTRWVIQVVKPLPKGVIFKGGRRDLRNKFLDKNGNFSRYGSMTWFFETKKEAKSYASDGYNWGELNSYVEYKKVLVIFVKPR